MIYHHAVKAFGKIYMAGEEVPEQADALETTAPESPILEEEQQKEEAQPPAPKRTSKAKGKASC